MTKRSSFARIAQRRPHPMAGLALLFLVLLTACQSAPLATAVPGAVQPSPAPRPTVTPARQPLHLVLLHTNDTWGYLWPCG